MKTRNDLVNAVLASKSSTASRKQSRLAAQTLVVAAIGIGFAFSSGAHADVSATSSNQALLSAASGWTYQLQGLDPKLAARDAADLLVIDHSLDGTSEQVLAPDEVEALKLKPDGGRRLVVAYMSIGEAESYRYYWNNDWTAAQLSGAKPVQLTLPQTLIPALADLCVASDASVGSPLMLPPPGVEIPAAQTAPNWLHHENAQWKGNYYVRFWQAEWQDIIFGTSDSYLDRVIDAGFDGVYLDRADIYAYWQSERDSSEADMVDFISRLSTYAKERNPAFLVILQNAEELARQSNVRNAIDAVAKEDLLFGNDHTEAANSPRDITESVRHLNRAKASGKPIFAVEYLADVTKIAVARKQLVALGFVPTFAPRALDGSTR